MTTRYTRRPHRADHQCFEYTRASRDDFAIWAHVAYFLLLILAVLAVTALFGFWSPS